MKTDKYPTVTGKPVLRILVFTMIVLLLSGTSFAQGLNARHVKTNAKEFPKKVVTSLLVYDNYDNPVKELNKTNFTMFVEGKKGDIAFVSTLASTGKGVYTVLCMDISGSMRGKPMDNTKDAVLRYIDELGDKDNLAIYSYGDGANLVADFSNDKTYLKEQVKKLTAKDQNTSLFYGADKGLEKLRGKASQDEPVIMIVMGDGNNENQNEAYKIDDVIAKAKEIGVPVFTFGYTSGGKTQLQNLEKMGVETGGRYYESPDKEQLDENFKKMRENILNIYLVAYSIYGLEGKGQDANGQFTVTKGEIKSETTGKFKLAVASMISEPEEKSDIPWLYIIIGVGVLVIVAAVMLVLNSKKKKKLEAERRRRLEEESKEDARRAAEAFSEGQRSEQGQRGGDPAKTVIEELQTGGGGNTPQNVPTDATVIMRSGSASHPAGTGATLILDIKVGELAGRQFTVTTEGAIIGRSAQEATLVLPVTTVSKRHAKISFNGTSFIIEDLNSSNGVFVNMSKILSPTPIVHGNSFKIGGCEGHFLINKA
ncbi:hypothetical protein MASR2M39_20690 [Ignavibacteriales bacterium]